jgi:ribosomal protein S18 acetylase RimI-like enzyme
MLKATHTLSNLEKHQMQQILNQYTLSSNLLEEKLKVIEEEKDYVMEPYYLYYQEGRVTGFVLIEFVIEDMLQAKIYVEHMQQMDLLLRQFKSYLGRSNIKTALFCTEEEIDLNEVQSLKLNSCEYRLECSYNDFSNWVMGSRKVKSMLRWMKEEDESFYRNTLETTFSMDFLECEERFLSIKEDFDCINNGVLVGEECMVGVVLETKDGVEIGIGGCYIGNRCITLFDIAVLESYRRQGFGRDLLYLIYEKTKHLKKNYLLQVSSESVSAVALYQKVGFVIQEQLYCYKMEA